jgi:hypothetical protein
MNGKNEYGLDTHYIGKNLKILLRDIKSYKPSEMRRALLRLAETLNKPETHKEEIDARREKVINYDYLK